MRDAITGLIGRYDQLGRYLDRQALDSIETYLDESVVRIAAVELINREAAEIVREAKQGHFYVWAFATIIPQPKVRAATRQ